MKLRHLPLVLLLLPASAFAQKQQYINDQITVSLRDGPRNDATFLGLLKSGDAVTVLENLGEQSFAKVRTADGREGWVTARFLSDTPAAASLLDDVRRDLAAAQSRIGSLEQALEDARAEPTRTTAQTQTLQPPQPPPQPPPQSDAELTRQNGLLRAQIAELKSRIQSAQPQSGEQEIWRGMMLTGGALLAAGVVLGLLLQWIVGAGRKRRHWSDF
ncbi:MAG: TIGR04211 family SH3 domain-containing protein [Sinimarinibacterium sp.]|jgi:SH3 domain protein